MTPRPADPSDFEDVVRCRLGLDPVGLGARGMSRALAAASHAVGDGQDVLGTLQDASIWSVPWQAAIAELTIRETSFFRQQEWIGLIRDEILAPLIDRRRSGGHRFVHVLSAGTASGEEAYTLAMLLDMLTTGSGESWQLRVRGTDLCKAALDHARQGRYRARALREVAPDLLSRYFTASEDGTEFSVSPRIRDLVRFDPLNLADLRDPARLAVQGRYDLILCRNVLMYMMPATRNEIADALASLLMSDGWLIASPAESADKLSSGLVRQSFGHLLAFRPADAPAVSPPAAPVRNTRTFPPVASRPVVEKASGVEVPEISKAPAPKRSSPVSPREEETLDVGVLLDAAFQAEAKGAGEAAISLLKRVLYLEPGNVEAHFRLGGLLRRCGRPDQGIRHDRSALAYLDARSDDDLLRPGHEIQPKQVRAALLGRLAQEGVDG